MKRARRCVTAPPESWNQTGAPGSEKPVDVLAGFHQLLGLWVEK